MVRLRFLVRVQRFENLSMLKGLHNGRTYFSLPVSGQPRPSRSTACSQAAPISIGPPRLLPELDALLHCSDDQGLPGQLAFYLPLPVPGQISWMGFYVVTGGTFVMQSSSWFSETSSMESWPSSSPRTAIIKMARHPESGEPIFSSRNAAGRHYVRGLALGGINCVSYVEYFAGTVITNCQTRATFPRTTFVCQP